MAETSPRLNLPYIQPSQAQKHVTHNEAIELLDAITQLAVESFDAEHPPTEPFAGETYALGASPTGLWASQANKIATYSGSGWMFISPQKGWRAGGGPNQELRIWDGSEWASVFPTLDAVKTLGINAAADTTNRLSLSSDASLFNNAGGGHQVKVNKAADSDTASLLFQSGWTGHAEMGLAGDNSFSIKVSADGSEWSIPLKIDPASDVQINAPVVGSAVQADNLDASAGRLMKTGAFGLGAPSTWLSDVNVTDNSISPGIYHLDGTTLGAPRPTGKQHLLHTRRSATGGEAQLVMVEDDGSMFYRARGTENWQGWQQIATSDHFTGDMSNSATNPLFERGTNANGDYTRFADGTLMCWHTLPLVFHLERELQGNWSYPMGFSSPPKVFCSVDFTSLQTTSSAEADAISTVTTEGVSEAEAQFRLLRAAGQGGFAAGDSVTISALAFGRWK